MTARLVAELDPATTQRHSEAPTLDLAEKAGVALPKRDSRAVSSPITISDAITVDRSSSTGNRQAPSRPDLVSPEGPAGGSAARENLPEEPPTPKLSDYIDPWVSPQTLPTPLMRPHPMLWQRTLQKKGRHGQGGKRISDQSCFFSPS